MGRWKRRGLIIVQFKYDHYPPHVHIFKNKKLVLKFDIKNWKVMDGRVFKKALLALEDLIKEGVLNEKSKD